MLVKSDPAHVFGYWLISESNYNINIIHLLEHYYIGPHIKYLNIFIN